MNQWRYWNQGLGDWLERAGRCRLRQHNCVAGYAERVAGGDTYIYRVLAPQRATLSLVRWSGGGWPIGELLRAGNSPVSAATRRSVREWLENSRL